MYSSSFKSRNVNLMVGDFDSPDFTKCVPVEEPQLIAAVAQDERLMISGQTPAFTRIAERSARREAREVVDERNIGTPRQLHQLAVPPRQPLSEICAVETVLLDHIAGFELDLSQRGPDTGSMSRRPAAVRRLGLAIGWIRFVTSAYAVDSVVAGHLRHRQRTRRHRRRRAVGANRRKRG